MVDLTKINKLDAKTISQIAAGEIIENPASLVKELVENSIDAQAKNIYISTTSDPTKEIRVTDDGTGLDPDQLGLAFARHATSKLESFDDLGEILTLGFRGEALASIANIARISLVTRREEDPLGTQALVEEGEVTSLKPIGAPKGTSIVVRDLFYKVPVRKNYLASDKKEVQAILDLVEKLALSHPEVSFHLVREGKTLLRSKADSHSINHIYSLLGPDIVENLIPIEFTTESYKIRGYISNNKLYRSTQDREYLFVNGRYVKSPAISKKIRSIYHTIIPLGRYPVFIIYLDIDPILVDVNIHPQKREVKLSEENYLLLILERLVRSALMPERAIPDLKPQAREEDEARDPGEMTIFDYARDQEAKKREDQDRGLDNLKGREVQPIEDKDPAIGQASKDPRWDLDKFDRAGEGEVAYSHIRDLDRKAHGSGGLDIRLEEVNFLAACFDTYLAYEERARETLILLDQHAAHERIRFEKIYRSLKDQEVYSQVLAQPLVLDLSPADYGRLEANIQIFEDFGFVLEPFGAGKLILREVPVSDLVKDPKTFIYDALLELEDGKGVIEKNIYNVMRMACRSAIKAGDRVSEMEAMDLLEDLAACDLPHTCPHGRPTLVRISKRDLEKVFLREGG